MPIIRSYQCGDCGESFEVTHDSGDEPFADCPYCKIVMEWRPVSFNIGTHKGKAIDITQKIIEEDFGMTDFKDNLREGDIAAKLPVETTADREAAGRMRAEIAELEATIAQTKPVNPPGIDNAIKGFWGGPAASSGLNDPGVIQTMLASAKVGRMQDGSKYVDPIGALHEGAKRGIIPTNFRKIS